MRFHPQCMAFWIGKGRCFSQKFRDRWSSGKQTMVFTPKCPTIILRKQTCSAWACSIDGSTSLRENRDHRTQKWDGFNWALECDQNKTSPLAWNPYHPHNLFLNCLNLQFYWSNLCQLLKFIPPVFGWVQSHVSYEILANSQSAWWDFAQWIHHHNFTSPPSSCVALAMQVLWREKSPLKWCVYWKSLNKHFLQDVSTIFFSTFLDRGDFLIWPCLPQLIGCVFFNVSLSWGKLDPTLGPSHFSI